MSKSPHYTPPALFFPLKGQNQPHKPNDEANCRKWKRFKMMHKIAIQVPLRDPQQNTEQDQGDSL